MRLKSGTALLAVLLCLLLGTATPVRAQAEAGRGGTVQVMEAFVHARDSTLLLSASLDIVLPELVDEALHKGIPIFFVAQTRILRERWYWSDRVMAQVQRYYRLSYQPLTDRWRLSVSGERPQSGGGWALGQNFDNLEQALAVLRRIVDWRLANAADFSTQDVYTVEFGLQLDVSQLPRPLQIGMTGQTDWRLGALIDFQWSPSSRPAVARPAAPPAPVHPAPAEPAHEPPASPPVPSRTEAPAATEGAR